MHVGMLCHNYPPHPGGLEVMLKTLCLGLSRQHRVTVVSSSWGGQKGVTYEDGVQVIRLPAIHATETLGVPYPVPLGPDLAAAVGTLKSADVFHAHGALYATTLLAAALARAWDRPLVLTEHVGFVEYRQWAINALERTAWRAIGDTMLRASTEVSAYNWRVKQWIERRCPGRIVHYIGNGVDTLAFRPRTSDERRALRARFQLPGGLPLTLYVGRNSEKKNLDAVLRMPRNRWGLVVCGAQRGLTLEGVFDLGVIPYHEMPDLFGCVDLMVHASTGEGFPLAVQEAMASGLSVALLWDDGYRGWLDRATVAGCETLDELGAVVTALANDPSLRADLGSRARAWAENCWNWEATVRGYEHLYGRAL
jgi:D-inositol-3-phosphate glycosyltransferase